MLESNYEEIVKKERVNSQKVIGLPNLIQICGYFIKENDHYLLYERINGPDLRLFFINSMNLSSKEFI